MLESQRHWLANHGGIGFFSILVREAPPASQEGEHAHQLVHVPDQLRAGFIDHVRAFLRGNSRHQAKALVWTVPYNEGKLAYILKGATRPARELLRATIPTAKIENTEGKRCQGIIPGKRLLISHALGPMARQDTSKPEADDFSRRDALAA